MSNFLFNSQTNFLATHTESRFCMTALTIIKIAFSESAFIVMASHTAHCTARRKMLSDDGGANLSFLRRAGFDRMTIGAV
jgi:hypothetical protein